MNLIITNRAKKDLVKLKGFNDKWRIRVGVYRVIMRVEGTFVTVYALRVLHRREAYTIKG